jgi:Ca2+-binding EF-hand superfamily protein
MDEIQAALDSNLPQIMLFDQIDLDHTGQIRPHEFRRLLEVFPDCDLKTRGRGDEGRELINLLDSGNTGTISLEEWLENLQKPELSDLKEAIDGAIDKRTGKLVGWMSEEDHLKRLIENREDIETHIKMLSQERDDVSQQIENISKVVGSVGKIVFNQIDLDQTGFLSVVELRKVLNHLHSRGFMKGLEDKEINHLSMGKIMKRLDRQKNGKVSEAEWLTQLERVEGLKECLEAAVDLKTGRIEGYITINDELEELNKTIAAFEERRLSGVVIATDEAEAHEESVQRREDLIKLKVTRMNRSTLSREENNRILGHGERRSSLDGYAPWYDDAGYSFNEEKDTDHWADVSSSDYDSDEDFFGVVEGEGNDKNANSGEKYQQQHGDYLRARLESAFPLDPTPPMSPREQDGAAVAPPQAESPGQKMSRQFEEAQREQIKQLRATLQSMQEGS